MSTKEYFEFRESLNQLKSIVSQLSCLAQASIINAYKFHDKLLRFSFIDIHMIALLPKTIVSPSSKVIIFLKKLAKLNFSGK